LLYRGIGAHIGAVVSQNAKGHQLGRSTTAPSERKRRSSAWKKTAKCFGTQRAGGLWAPRYQNMAMMGGFLYVAAAGARAWSLYARWLHRGR
jgi:hypothetical protein